MSLGQVQWVEVYNVTRGCIVAPRVELADTAATRMRGLLGRDGLAPGEGLIIEPCNSIHTFFMRFSIDVAFLSTDGKIVRQISALPPWRLTWMYFRARKVLELSAGVLAASGTQQGDRLELRAVPGQLPINKVQGGDALG